MNPEAYERYLEGRYLCDQWRPGDMATGMRLLREAIAREPGSAAAHGKREAAQQAQQRGGGLGNELDVVNFQLAV